MYRNFALKDLEREYSPSSCIDDISPYIQQYIEQSQQVFRAAKAQQKVLTDLPYNNHEDGQKEQILDLFLPFDTVKNEQKLHVYIHGGYWQELSKNESCFAASNFQQQGYHLAVVNYALAPKVSLSEIVEQCRQSLVWLYQHAEQYGYDKKEITLSGSSAGGHLVMMLALTDWSKYLDVKNNIVKGICAVSGIFDLTPIAQTYINEPLQLTHQEIAENSPLLLAIDNKQLDGCDIIIAYGDNETSEFKRQSLAMKMHLEKMSINVTFKEVAQRNHFDVILDLAKPETWLSQQVFAQ